MRPKYFSGTRLKSQNQFIKKLFVSPRNASATGDRTRDADCDSWTLASGKFLGKKLWHFWAPKFHELGDYSYSL